MKRIVELLKELGAVKVVLFGSAVDKPQDAEDVDILALFCDNDTFKKRMERIYKALDVEIDCDLIAYNFEEWERMKKRAFWRSAMKNSRVLYERP